MLEQFPIVVPGVAVGYIAGLAIDTLSVKKASENLGGISLSHESTANEINSSSEVSKIKKNASRFIAPLALTGAFLGGSVGMLFQGSGAKVKEPSTIEIVVDHSGYTIGDGSIGSVNDIASSFSGNKNFDSKVLIAGSGQIVVSKPELVASDNPFGIAPLDQALTSALTQISSSQGESKNTNKSNAVLVISDDNSVGSIDSAISLAKSSNIPVFTVDVSSSKNQTSSDLNKLATSTGGNFWQNPSADKRSKIADKIYSSISESSNSNQKSANGNVRDLALIFSVISLGAFVSLAANRRYIKFDRNITGK